MALAQSLASLGRRMALARQPWAALATRQVGTSHAVGSAQPAEHAAGADKGWGSTSVGSLLASRAGDSGAWLFVAKDDLVIEAVRKMAKGNVGSLLVLDPSKSTIEGGQPKPMEDAVCGIVTERDYLTKMVVQGRSSLSTKVSEIMTPGKKLVTVEPSDSVMSVMELMADRSIRHVPVVHDGMMLGMVSMRDVVQTMVKEHRDEVGQLQDYIAGSY